ncbi:MAG: 2-dehydropantoate 2-reductase [Propionibacteriaceae bacterium]|jgi:2-dehydropantoate 2-reductase|nr:2-dehydropantoate 2-reductase [Propionibacteriaceae bacterium]
MAKLGIMGLGALGAAHLATVLDHDAHADVAVIASGSRAERLRKDGVVVNGKLYSVRILEPGEGVEVILLAVKNTVLSEAIADLAPFVTPGVAIVSLLNGVSSERELRAAFPQAFVPLAYSIRSNAGRDSRGFRYYSVGVDTFGDGPADELSRIDAVLTEVGLPHEVSPDIQVGQWQKFVLNVGINQASALLCAKYYPFQQEGTQARNLLVGLAREGLAVAQAHGVGLTDANFTEILRIIDSLDPAGYTSMSQDAMYHNPMETASFAGEVSRLGRLYGVPTPLNDAAGLVLGALEETWK